MSLKTSLILIAILVLLCSYIFIFQQKKQIEVGEKAPKVWFVKEEDIERIEIRLTNQGLNAAFVKDAESNWHFEDAEKSAVDIKRWSGIPLLVSGPTSKRLIAQRVDDLTAYGLHHPQMEITMNIQNQGSLKVLVGDKTPNEMYYYVKLNEADDLYTVDHNWTEVLERLVTDPPKLSP
ncbi:MAG: DUF4340 domain-containing protein [Candidatus Tectomicrobia bacterium]|uniref:DUF4340 domain-containing protein n=1 Tax=Tectimicrobiota bacterium TaxID=2528274 RepID=A0A933GL49_UNCTE|nr:DUF4340 domain-containing protein [Candidatus Tectomicrobia bacterium]